MQAGTALLSRVNFEHESFLDADLSDVTVAYTCATCFNEKTLKKMVKNLCNAKNLRLIASLKPLDSWQDSGMELMRNLTYAATWHSEVAVYLYKRTKQCSSDE